MVPYSEKRDGYRRQISLCCVYLLRCQSILVIRLLSSARVGGRHNGQNPDEDVDCVHVYSNRPAEKHIFFNSPFVLITGFRTNFCFSAFNSGFH